MSYRAGVIGCGRIGCGFDDDPRRRQVSTHAGAYRRTPSVELVALADLDEAKLARYGERLGVMGRYRDYRAMLDRERLDILSVCTWNHTHREIIEAAVESGVKAIFCEKPIADSLADADAIIERCAERGVLLLVNHKRRFDPFHQRIAEALRSGALGRIQQVSCHYTSGLANTGTHLFDLLRMYFGDVVWLQGLPSASGSGRAEDPNVDGWLQFAAGFPAAIQACDVSSYYLVEVHVLGTKGRWQINTGTSEALRCEIAAPSAHTIEYNDLQVAPPPIAANEAPEYMLQGVRHLVECLTANATPLCSGEDGRKALEIVCALRESAAEGGRRIELPLQDSAVRVLSQ